MSPIMVKSMAVRAEGFNVLFTIVRSVPICVMELQNLCMLIVSTITTFSESASPFSPPPVDITSYEIRAKSNEVWITRPYWKLIVFRMLHHFTNGLLSVLSAIKGVSLSSVRYIPTGKRAITNTMAFSLYLPHPSWVDVEFPATYLAGDIDALPCPFLALYSVLLPFTHTLSITIKSWILV